MTGSITVIAGPMKCGKSEELARRMKRFHIAGKNTIVFKPDTDKRFSDDEAVGRDGSRLSCTVIPAHNPEYIFSCVDECTDVVVIDEAQFFDPPQYILNDGDWNLTRSTKLTITDVVQKLSDRGICVIVAGLDMTSDRKPFGNMGDLMAIAHTVIKLRAVCELCGSEDAVYSYADFDKTHEIVLGDKEYKAVCHHCYQKRKIKRRKPLFLCNFCVFIHCTF